MDPFCDTGSPTDICRTIAVPKSYLSELASQAHCNKTVVRQPVWYILWVAFVTKREFDIFCLFDIISWLLSPIKIE